jgi:hypothetical protein
VAIAHAGLEEEFGAAFGEEERLRHDGERSGTARRFKPRGAGR